MFSIMFSILPVELYNEILSYFDNTKDFLNFFLIKKEIYNWLYDQNACIPVRKAENITFLLKDIEKIDVTKFYHFIYNLQVNEYYENENEIKIFNFKEKQCKNLKNFEIYGYWYLPIALRGIKVLNVPNCYQTTDKMFASLKGISNLNTRIHNKITDKRLEIKGKGKKKKNVQDVN